jgi:RNA-dependent RNA polymerase
VPRRHIHSHFYPYSPQDGVFDGRCLELSRLCRTALDYATNGKPVEINNGLPKPLVKPKPDWHCPEVAGTRRVDHYVSDRALGHLYRNIDMHSPDELLPVPSLREVAPLDDPISRTLAPLVQTALNAAFSGGPWVENALTERLHARYASEMRYICVTHGLAPDVRLTEEETVLGTILTKSTQPRWRTDRAYSGTTHTETVLRDLRGQIVSVSLGEDGLRDGLRDAWAMWGWAQHHGEKPFIQSFALVALGLIFDLLQRLGILPDAGVHAL